MLDKNGQPPPSIQGFQAYLQEVLAFRPGIEAWEGEKVLPLSLRELYAFYRTRLPLAETLLMVPKGEVGHTAATLAKHMHKVREKWTQDLVYVKDAATSLERKRLMEQRIPFVIPGNQMYLPMLGMDLREHFRKIQTARTSFSPSTQVLVLDALYHPNHAPYTLAESALRFGYTLMTMARAFDELEQAELGEHSLKGKARQLLFPGPQKILWEAALPYLKSPVKKTAVTEIPINVKARIRAGLSALAEYSNLAKPAHAVYALDSETWQGMPKTRMRPASSEPEPGEAVVELWTYRPDLFARKEGADPISIFLSLKHSEDERVQAALKELLRDQKW